MACGRETWNGGTLSGRTIRSSAVGGRARKERTRCAVSFSDTSASITFVSSLSRLISSWSISFCVIVPIS